MVDAITTIHAPRSTAVAPRQGPPRVAAFYRIHPVALGFRQDVHSVCYHRPWTVLQILMPCLIHSFTMMLSLTPCSDAPRDWARAAMAGWSPIRWLDV